MRLLRRKLPLIALCLASTGLSSAADDPLGVHEDYYRGFSHGAYYGLMLAGVEYDVAWCMKAELEYEAAGMGTGADFQRKMETLLATCRDAPDTAGSIHAIPSES